MSTLRRGVEAIRRAEDALRELLAEAAAGYRYEELLILGEWAKQLHEIAFVAEDAYRMAGRDDAEASEPDVDNAIESQAQADCPDRMARQPVAEPPAHGNGHSPTRPSAKVKKGGPRSQRDYPRFLRDGEHLVKIGWSKKERKQYEHKAPKGVLDLLLASLLEAGRDGHRFTTEDVLPLRDSGDGAEIPSYQAYLCLAWLRSEDLVEQHGRQGYSLPLGHRLAELVGERWGGLSRR